MLKIYGRANSINVRKVLWMCGEIGVAFEREDWGRDYRPTNEPAFLAVSDFGVVPVVDDSGFILRESNTIVRYLATKHGRSDLYPADPQARAIVEQWMDYGSTDLGIGMRSVFQGKALGLAPWHDPKVVAHGITEWNRQFTRLDQHLAAGNAYMLGDRFTVADIPIGVMVNRWLALDFEKPELAAVRAYFARLSERAAYRQHVANGVP